MNNIERLLNEIREWSLMSPKKFAKYYNNKFPNSELKATEKDADAFRSGMILASITCILIDINNTKKYQTNKEDEIL